MKNLRNILSVGMAAILGFLTPFNSAWAGTRSVDDADPNAETPETWEMDDEAPEAWEIPEIYFKAVNPGYKTDDGENDGEMIEIARKNADEPFLLAGATVGYTNSNGNKDVLLEFPEGSEMTGETILLRLASSPNSELANTTYAKTLAMSGGIELTIDGEVIDQVCWTGKDGCAAKFKSATPTTLVRNLETGEWEHKKEEYEPEFAAENYFAPEPEPELEPDSELGSGKGEGGEVSDDGETGGEDGETDAETDDEMGPTDGMPQCQGLQFSEIFSYYATDKSEQFVEFYNSSAAGIQLDGCAIRYKSKYHALTGMVGAGEYVAYYPNEDGFSLTKNPTSSNELALIDADETEVDVMEYPNGQRKEMSYALTGHDEAGEEIWQLTYALTPGAANEYQEFRACEEGKVLNPATGNCVKAAVATTSTAAKTCATGYYLNAATGRCNKIKTSASTTTECKEGYYRDPTTNRCRQLKENDGAEYALELPEEYEETSSFIALYAVLGVVAVGGGYLVYEYRHDIGRALGKLKRKLGKMEWRWRAR